MTGDRNASLLAAADGVMDRLDVIVESRSSWRADPNPAIIAIRDAIYDALASSSASGAGQMREAAAVEATAHTPSDVHRDDLYSWKDVAAELAEAIRALPLPEPAPVPAWRPRVKALEWDNEEAETEIGSYEVVKYGRVFAVYLNRNLVTGEPASLKAAKAAAQADYEARILSALEGDASEPAWRPIETAPKDGTRILVSTSYAPNPVHEASWDRDAGELVFATGALCRNALYWQPLPPPPQTDGGHVDA